MRFAKEAWPFVVPFFIAALVAALAGYPRSAVGLAVAGILVLLFFRDPRRRFDGSEAVVIAAADGKITRISTLEDPEIGAGRFHRIVTFLSVFDVHVQHCPVDGEIVRSELRRGAKLAAFHPDVGEKNEGHTNVFALADGDRVGVRQLAGLVARRVVSYLKVGDRPARGELLGVIKFGSRVDLFVPDSYRVLVAVGDRVRGGETAMAERGSNA
jgi:phosphatidylserine decarboxylase